MMRDHSYQVRTNSLSHPITEIVVSNHCAVLLIADIVRECLPRLFSARYLQAPHTLAIAYLRRLSSKDRDNPYIP